MNRGDCPFIFYLGPPHTPKSDKVVGPHNGPGTAAPRGSGGIYSYCSEYAIKCVGPIDWLRPCQSFSTISYWQDSKHPSTSCSITWPATRAHLQVLHWVPIVLHKDHGVGARKIQSQASHVRRQQEDVNGRVIVESNDAKQSTR